MDGFARVGAGTIILLGVLTVGTYFVDVAIMALGMKRLGTTKRAMQARRSGPSLACSSNAGLIIGPFAGAVIGELTAHRDLARAGRAGIAAWLGFLIGTVVKVGLAFAMVGIFDGVVRVLRVVNPGRSLRHFWPAAVANVRRCGWPGLNRAVNDAGRGR